MQQKQRPGAGQDGKQLLKWLMLVAFGRGDPLGHDALLMDSYFTIRSYFTL
jgi:hypothetical protein